MTIHIVYQDLSYNQFNIRIATYLGRVQIVPSFQNSGAFFENVYYTHRK